MTIVFSATIQRHEMSKATRDVYRFGFAASFCAFALIWPLSTVAATKTVHIVFMGGDDCPPCVVWIKQELPKLQASPEFAGVRFSYVDKTVKSAVPELSKLPDEVKPFKAVLDKANAGQTGSPQTALMIDGAVYDYYLGDRPAKKIEAMLYAIRTGTPYPSQRCLVTGWPDCALVAK
jgi:hypothetical protein